MTRSGPPGRTAAERNSHLTRVQTQDPAEHGTGAPADARLLSDADEDEINRQWQEAKDAGQPVSRRYLREKLRRELARAADHWEGGAVLTYVTRRGSVPVDARVGELVASRLSA